MTNYKKLTDKEHILLRPGMYVGSTKHRKITITLPQEGEVVKRELNINPAFVKIFDEILSNSADEHRRQKTNGKSSLTEITVKIDKDKNVIRVHDNGGIPVHLHDEYEEWIPQIIFGTLRAGSNFDDSEERLVAGTNGVGSTLTNIFSLAFKVRTCDGKKLFEQTYKNNMDSMSSPQVSDVPAGTKGFTEITFIPDLKRFEMSNIDEDHIWALYKRCLDVAAANPKLRVSFQVMGTPETVWKFSSFQDYCNLFRPKEELFYEESERWKIGISHSETGALEQISFVNSVDTIDGGTHVDAVADIVVSHLREFLKKKHKIEVKPAEIKSQMMILVCCDIVNAQFSSQTKEKLITEPKSFGSLVSLGKGLLKDLEKSEIVNRIIDWNSQKLLAEESKKMREINKNISREKILKLVDAKSRNREACVLQLYEGDSAMSAFRKFRDPATQGAFPLRGKFLNVSEISPTEAFKNKEVAALMTAINLKLGEEPNNLRYGKILIYSDADPDGDSIAGLLTNFFGRYWPKLVEEGRIARVQTPLVVAKKVKGNATISFYTDADFKSWLETAKVSDYSIEYKKGLASLEDAEYKEIIQSPRYFTITSGDNLHRSLVQWFGSDPAYRKKALMPELDDGEES